MIIIAQFYESHLIRKDIAGSFKKFVMEHVERKQKRTAEISNNAGGRRDGKLYESPSIQLLVPTYCTFTVDLSKPPPPRDSSFR